MQSVSGEGRWSVDWTYRSLRHLLPESVSRWSVIGHHQYGRSAAGDDRPLSSRDGLRFVGRCHHEVPERVMDVKQQLSSASGSSTRCHQSAAVSELCAGIRQHGGQKSACCCDVFVPFFVSGFCTCSLWTKGVMDVTSCCSDSPSWLHHSLLRCSITASLYQFSTILLHLVGHSVFWR